MSGTGKSSVIEKLQMKNFVAIDTDYDNWKEYSEANKEWVLRENKLLDLVSKTCNRPIFISGCCSNQTKFYKYFNHIILLSASLETILDRVSKRTSNPYGNSPQERAEIIWNFENIQPILKKKIDIEFDTETVTIDQISNELTKLVTQ